MVEKLTLTNIVGVSVGGVWLTRTRECPVPTFLYALHLRILPFDDDGSGDIDPNALECLRCYHALMVLLWLTLIPTNRRWVWW